MFVRHFLAFILVPLVILVLVSVAYGDTTNVEAKPPFQVLIYKKPGQHVDGPSFALTTRDCLNTASSFLRNYFPDLSEIVPTTVTYQCFDRTGNHLETVTLYRAIYGVTETGVKPCQYKNRFGWWTRHRYCDNVQTDFLIMIGNDWYKETKDK